jgi:hypothetical protein
MLRELGIVFVLTLIVAVIGCSKKESTETADAGETTETPETSDTGKTPQTDASEQPKYIVLQHLLVGFDGSIPGRGIGRSKEDAEDLANKLYERATKGEDFDLLVSQHTDDSHPGIYKLANFGVEADLGQGVFGRAQMVRAFGDVGFQLEVGELGMAEYDPETSQYGWHIIKRVE